MSNPVNREIKGKNAPKKVKRPREWMPLKLYPGYLRDSQGRIKNAETGHILPVQSKMRKHPVVFLWRDGVIIEAEVRILKDGKL